MVDDLSPRGLPFSLVNGEWGYHLPLGDRGLAYGDGLFETLLWRAGEIPLLERHLARLSDGCQRLAIPFVPHQDLQGSWQRLLPLLMALWQSGSLPSDQVLIKITVTRGDGGQGYWPPSPAETQPTCIFQCRSINASPSEYYGGVALQACAHSLSHNPLLAGIKHLNRLEYVLAAQSVGVQTEQILLLQDHEGAVIETLQHNIFIVQGDELHTPVLDCCGVRGVARTEIIDRAAPALNLPVVERRLDLQDLQQADEILICNSVRGIWPVVSLGETLLAPGMLTRALQQQTRAVWEAPNAP